MKRRAFLERLAMILASPCLTSARAGVSPAYAGSAGHSSGMSVLCIDLGTLPAAALACYGHPALRTPNLDRFAETATRFTRCYSQSPIGRTSHRSVLTGLRPDTAWASANASPPEWRLPDDRDSLPSLMARYGLTPATWVRDPNQRPTADRSGLTTELPAQLKHLAVAKTQFFAVADFSRRCAKAGSSQVTPQAVFRIISSLDTEIGRALDTLDKAGLTEDTIVVIFSRHGASVKQLAEPYERPLSDRHTRVPLFVRVPGLSTEGGVCDEIVELVDLFPTLCELLAVPCPGNLEGASFVPLLSDIRQPWKLAAFASCVTRAQVGRSVRTKRWRYIDWQSRHTARRQFELYDLLTDPEESDNLALAPAHRTQRTILANLLQRGWVGASRFSPPETERRAAALGNRCEHRRP